MVAFQGQFDFLISGTLDKNHLIAKYDLKDFGHTHHDHGNDYGLIRWDNIIPKEYPQS